MRVGEITHSHNADEVNNDRRKKNVVIVIGSCGLDRLMYVSKYPQPDDKVRAMAYHEIGGGNAANTASAMALLSDASLFFKNKFEIQLLTKLGNDHVGKQLRDELQNAKVNVSSPLFKIGEEGTTTSFTSIIVSTDENTRTCIHTPGTCGPLTATDVTQIVNDHTMDDVMERAVHIHCDCRHPSAELAMAKEAKKRQITISVDIEKDRYSEDVDQLLVFANIVFTNSRQVDEYLSRLTREYQTQHGGVRGILQEPTITSGNIKSNNENSDGIIKMYANAIKPNVFFIRHFAQTEKQVVITKGSLGALHVRCKWFEKVEDFDSSSPINEVHVSSIGHSSGGVGDGFFPCETIRVQHKFTDKIMIKQDGTTLSTSNNELISAMFKAEYEIVSVGVLSDADIVDTTGAGDAFIGGYLMLQLFLQERQRQERQRQRKQEQHKEQNQEQNQEQGQRVCAANDDGKNHDKGSNNDMFHEDQIIHTCLRFASWVGGKKLAGPGSRSALPKGVDVDEYLGSDLFHVQQSLGDAITSFHN